MALTTRFGVDATTSRSGFAINLIERTDLAMLAVQRPKAYRVVSDVLGDEAGAIIQA